MFVMIDLRSDNSAAKRVVYLGVTWVQVAFLVWFVSQRGSSLWDRYVLIAVVLIVPLAAYAFSDNSSLTKRCFVGVAMIGSMLLSVYIDHSTLYIRFKVPDAVSEATAWLERRLEAGETFISTRLKGDAPTIDLVTGSMPYNVAYSHHSDEELQDVWRSVRPSYMVVLAGEEPGNRLLQQFRSQIDWSEPPERLGEISEEFGEISIYRVKHDDEG